MIKFSKFVYHYAIYIAIFLHIGVILGLYNDNPTVRIDVKFWVSILMEIISLLYLIAVLLLSKSMIRSANAYKLVCIASIAFFLFVITILHYLYYDAFIIGEWNHISLWLFHLFIIVSFLAIKIIFDVWRSRKDTPYQIDP